MKTLHFNFILLLFNFSLFIFMFYCIVYVLKSYYSYYFGCVHQFVFLLKSSSGQEWWLTPVIPVLWEAETGGSRGQEIETILVNMVKPCL